MEKFLKNRYLVMLMVLLMISCQNTEPPIIYNDFVNEITHVFDSKLDFENYEVFVYKDTESEVFEFNTYFLFKDKKTNEFIGLNSFLLDITRRNVIAMTDLRLLNYFMSSGDYFAIHRNFDNTTRIIDYKLRELKCEELLIIIDKMFECKIKNNEITQNHKIECFFKKVEANEIPIYLNKYFPLIKLKIKEGDAYLIDLGGKFIYFDVESSKCFQSNHILNCFEIPKDEASIKSILNLKTNTEELEFLSKDTIYTYYINPDKTFKEIKEKYPMAQGD